MVETKAPGDATELELQIREVNTGHVRLRRRARCSRRWTEVRADNAQGEHYLPDVLPILREHERTVDAYELADPDEMLGINDRRRSPRSRAVAQRQIHERHMLAGVTIVDPAATVIDVDVEIGPDAVIAPFTSLHGATTIGAGATVGPARTLIDAEVGEGATVLHSYVDGAEHRRPGQRRAVRLPAPRHGAARRAPRPARSSRSRTPTSAPGTKVPHLSYIGDADIGEGTNLGAGDDHRQLRRLPQAPHDDRRAGQDERRHDARRPGQRRRRRLHRRRLGDHQGRPRRARSGVARARQAQHRGLRRAAPARRRPRPSAGPEPSSDLESSAVGGRPYTDSATMSVLQTRTASSDRPAA